MAVGGAAKSPHRVAAKASDCAALAPWPAGAAMWALPFEDYADLPDPMCGLSPERCAHLGRAVLHPMALVLGELR